VLNYKVHKTSVQINTIYKLALKNNTPWRLLTMFTA